MKMILMKLKNLLKNIMHKESLKERNICKCFGTLKYTNDSVEKLSKFN